MADEQNILTTEVPDVIRGTSYLQPEYEKLAVGAMDLLRQVRKNHWEDDRDISVFLYGIFYSSMAGLLRAGVLHTRTTGIDGFPEIGLLVNDNGTQRPYRCRESVLRGILKEEADELINLIETHMKDEQ